MDDETSHDHRTGVEKDRDRYREHSVLLNKIGLRILEALGRPVAYGEAVVTDIEADLEKLIEKAKDY